MSPRSKEQIEKIRETSIANILSAALELFATKGFDSTSIAKIAEKAGVSKGLMYNYFTSKDELLKALIDQFAEGESQMMNAIQADTPYRILENVIRFFFKELRDNYQQWLFISKLVMQVERFDFVKSMATDKYHHYLLMLEELLNEVGMQNPKQEAELLAAILDGIGYQYLIIEKEYPLEDIENYLIKKYCSNENS
jgi:AcrR family transcriptional regulator